MSPPLVGQIDDQAGARRGACHRKGVVEDGELLQAVPGLAEYMTKGPVQEEHAGRFDSDSQFSHEGKRDRWYAAGFYFTREQSYGPRTDRSGRHQQNEIDVGLGQLGADLVAWMQQFVGIIGKAEAVVSFGDTAYNTLSL